MLLHLAAGPSHPPTPSASWGGTNGWRHHHEPIGGKHKPALLPKGLHLSKYATIYISNYTFVFHDAKICRKYAILGAFSQPPVNQRVAPKTSFLTPHIQHFVLPLGMFRPSKHAHPHCDTFPIEARLAIYRNSIHA